MIQAPSYPRQAKTDAGEIEFRPMSRADEVAVLDFAQRLPTHDLLFLPRDISKPKVLSAWINEIERGDITSLLAIRDGKVVGRSALVRDRHSWSPHVARRAWARRGEGPVTGDLRVGTRCGYGKTVGANDRRSAGRDRAV